MKYNGAYSKYLLIYFLFKFQRKTSISPHFIKTWKYVSSEQEVTFVSFFLVQHGEKTYVFASVHFHVRNGTQ